jgi:class 3 adenylate cyclase/pimeloyl-ACP methyl ester carboxylesterase
MEPQIRYATTTDSVRIAFTVSGKGPALLWVPDLPNSHVQLEWHQPGIGQQLEALAAAFTVVRFDARGVGLSDRDQSDFTMGARMRDLVAVIDAIPLESTFALMGVEWSGPLAITYAATHPEKVSHLILHNTFARSGEFAEHPRNQLSMSLLDRDWEMFVDTRISLAIGLGKEAAGAYSAYYRACVDKETAQRMFPQLARDDATNLLPSVIAPTLILQHSDLKARTDEMPRVLATQIPHAQLVTISGGYFDGVTEVVSAIVRFVHGYEVEGDAGDTAIILFADIVDSTRITEQIGDAAFRERARTLDEQLRAIVRSAAGEPVEGKLLGDGILAIFTSARKAIDAALGFATVAADVDLQLHLGIHAGDVIREQNNVFGGAVNIASRISGLSAPGEVLVSDVVRALARTSASVTFEDRGEHALKGVGEPQRVYAVRKGGS